jgi:hypothetical protein
MISGLSSIVMVPAFALQSLAQQPPELPLRDIFFDQGQFIPREDVKPVLGENAGTLAMNRYSCESGRCERNVLS